MRSSEAEIQAKAILALSALPGVRVHRNNVGSYEDPKTGRWVKYGVGGKGGPDLIVTQSIVVTADMVGTTICLFRPVECKTEKGRETREQEGFRKYYELAGAKPVVWRSDEGIKHFQL